MNLDECQHAGCMRLRQKKQEQATATRLTLRYGREDWPKLKTLVEQENSDMDGLESRSAARYRNPGTKKRSAGQNQHRTLLLSTPTLYMLQRDVFQP